MAEGFDTDAVAQWLATTSSDFRSSSAQAGRSEETQNMAVSPLASLASKQLSLVPKL